MGCEEFKPQECLLSLASKAHLLVFSETGFCLHEEAPTLQCELGTSGTGWTPSVCPQRAHCPSWTTCPPLGKHTGLGFSLGRGSCWETPALSLSWEKKEASTPWGLGCPVEASLLV